MVKIGLEIHGYLQTKEKLFCRCLAERTSSEPNKNICPICTGYPGSKPEMANKEAVKKILQIALMLNAKINSSFIWQRKHYDWPDLPKGFQTTISGSYAVPVAQDGEFLGIKVREMHLEEDPARWNPETGEVDYNRSGLPLVEIVTEPEFKDAEQVENWLKKLVLTLAYIKALDKNAGIKADVNISTSGERVEIKNMNSIQEIKKAIAYELKRQEKERVEKKETRAWQEDKGVTVKMREKEEADDYRFISEPDLPLIKIDNVWIKDLKDKLPESPEIKLEKIIKKHNIDKTNAEILTSNLELAEFFENIAEKIDAEFALPWVTVELLRVLNWNNKTLEQVDIQAEHFLQLLKLVKEKKITELKAKQILNEFIPKSFLVKLDGQEKIIDRQEIKKICEKVLQKNKKAAQDYRLGKQEALNFLLGEVMKISGKRADYKIAREEMINLLSKI